jgi:hypothetical protein
VPTPFQTPTLGGPYEARPVAIPVAVGTYDAPTVTHRPADGRPIRWRLPDDVAADLARAPSFAVRSLVAESTAGSETDGDGSDRVRVRVRVEVANEGDREGTFAARLLPDATATGSGDVWTAVSTVVPAGETRPVESTIGATPRVWLTFGDVERTATVD